MLFAKQTSEKAADADGYRLLVTNEWPKGFPKNGADGFNQNLAPKPELYKQLLEKQITFESFKAAYLSYLDAHLERLKKLAKQAKDFNVTLVAYPDFEGKSIGKILLEKCENL